MIPYRMLRRLHSRGKYRIAAPKIHIQMKTNIPLFLARQIFAVLGLRSERLPSCCRAMLLFD
jgi:hypothetical protein